ncbi:hypothetical protein F383_26447 [Gossypium arboreum]|uniref:Uncharacterized protein n=1 Tax=Gossypium arboreum TaxID=29729 RepID=A0A0B0P606_GOSAR|nr:hypothetical protein F383_26447 [Gossypium arboreum]
MVCLCEEV